MKRIILLITTIIIVAILIFSYNYIQYENKQADVMKFNKIFLDFNRNNLYGTDITTVMNKAVDNNEQYKIKKDESGLYIPDELFSIKIYIILEKEGSNFPMENFYKVGIKEFTKYFGELNFECIKVNYHESGRISEMFFQATNY
ncbi:MAG: hypothetical protein J6J60_04850 [Clostridia bacterium]|nr:hypothetical protein [Clostridia bacterium]